MGHASRQPSIPPRVGRVSVLVVRASHVTYCLKFRLAQRYLQGVNEHALTNWNRKNWRGRVSAAPRPWSLTPFLQDPIIGTTVCVIDHWKHTISQFVFKRFLSLLFHWLRCKVTSWWHVQLAVHVTTRLIWPELARSTTFVSNIRWAIRVRHGSLGF